MPDRVGTLSPRFEPASGARFLAAIAGIGAIVVASAVLACVNTLRVHETLGMVSHTNEVLATLAQVLSSSIDAETGERGYIITGDETYLEPYVRARSVSRARLDRLDELIADNPAQLDRAARLREQIDRELEILERGVAMRGEQGFEQVVAFVHANHAKETMDSARSIVATMRAEELRLLEVRTEASQRSKSLAMASAAVSGAVALFALAGYALSFRRQFRERNLAAAKLHAEKENFETTLDSIGDAVIATDLDGRVVQMNPVARSLTGWTLEAARGRPLAEVFHILNEDTRLVVESPVDRVLREGTVVGLANHTALVARDGQERPIADSGAPIRDLQGGISGVVLVFRDQSEERRMEALRARSLELEAQNHHTREASRLKSEFLANMSHELRTPLNAIIGFADLLHKGRVSPGMPEYAEFLDDIRSSGRHLLRLINDVLDLSKVEAGKMEFQPEPVDVSMLLEEVLGILRTTILDKNILVESQVDDRLADTVLDPARFKQLLYNYISNALKFTGRDGRIQVRIQSELDGRILRVEVEDNGVGIGPEDLGRLFNDFQQLDAGTAKQHGGTGLGLALTRRLVEAQEGRVGVRSVRGQGSVFHAALPRRTSADLPFSGPPPAPSTGPGKPSVLVVEDDIRDRGIIVRTLVDAGYEVEVAATGAQALERWRDGAHDAITLDLLLPDMSGLDVLREIESGDGRRRAPVIVITVVTEKGAVAGFAVHDFLSKPFDGAALLASLHRAGVFPARPGDVLVVDDDPASLRLMSATMTQLGYGAACVGSGPEGLAIAQRQPPRAVVLDLMMPGMDGFEFLDLFRQIPSCRRVPVIVWSMKDLTGEERARLKASTNGILAKAGDRAVHLVEELRVLLEAPGQSAEHQPA